MKKKLLLALTLVLFAVNILIGSALFAGRGGGGGGFSRRSSGSGGGRSGGYSSSRSYSGYSGHRSYSRGGGWFFIGGGRGGSGTFIIIGIIVVALIYFYAKKKMGSSSSKSKLVHLQLGFYLGDAKLQKELEDLVGSVDTDDPSGLTTLLRESALILKRYNDDIRWFYYRDKSCSSDDELESSFRIWDTEERAKLENIEFSNVDGRRSGAGNQSENLEEIVIVNIFAAVYDNSLSLSSPPNMQDVQKILNYFPSVIENNVAGSSVWWQILDNDEALEEYPELRSV